MLCKWLSQTLERKGRNCASVGCLKWWSGEVFHQPGDWVWALSLSEATALKGLSPYPGLSVLFCLGLVQPAVLWFLQARDFASVHTETLVKRHHSLYRELAAGTAVWSWERGCKYSRQQLYLCYIWFLASLLILLSEIVHVLMLMEVHGMGRRAMPITGPVVM